MKFKRYSWKIKKEKGFKRKIFKEYPLIGFRLRLFFKSSNGEKLSISSKLLKLEDVKTNEISIKKKKSFFIKKEVYSNEFIEEIINKNLNLFNVKELEIKEN